MKGLGLSVSGEGVHIINSQNASKIIVRNQKVRRNNICMTDLVMKKDIQNWHWR